MRKENRRDILFRYGFIVFLILLVSIRITYKLVDNTVISADEWNKKAMKVLSQVDTIAPVRGNILACDGSVLATNLRVYTPRIDYQCPKFNVDTLMRYLPALSDSMAKYFPKRKAKEWGEYLTAQLKKPDTLRSRSYPVISDISYEECQRLKEFPFFEKSRRITGLKVESRMARVRPYGAMARRSIGAVGVTAVDNWPHGKYGLEKALDSLLAGKPGVSKKVPLTKAIVNWTDIPPQNGYDVLTTIDIKMQDIVENELNKVLEYCDADWGVAVLMEVATGDIKAIANLEKSPRPGEGYIESMNRAALGFEPGSVVKTLSMLVALEDGIVRNLNEVIPTGASFPYAGGKPITDSHYTASLRVNEVLEQSSNIAMAKIITRRYGNNPGAYYTRIKSLGFLEPMHTGIAGELVPTFDSLPDTANGRRSLARQSYGYVTEISPLYTASLYNAIANGGRYVRPRLVKGLRGEGVDTIFPVTYIRDRICSESNAAILRDMLARVVWGDHGTARHVLRSDKVRIAGKTGTANLIENGTYVKGKNRLAFCGFFPAEAPLYTCMVLTSNPKQNWRGAPTTSGRVVLNVAENLYSRGMLNNSSDYLADAENVNPVPTFYASLDPRRNDKVQQGLALGNRKAVLQHPGKNASGVPDVRGLGLREALRLLECAGYRVAFTGAGFVAGQQPAPGTSLAKGQDVRLSLKE